MLPYCLTTSSLNVSELLSNFLDKFLFLLKAASDGWIVRYLGGNYYEIYKPNKKIKENLSTEKFIEKYRTKSETNPEA